MSSLTIVFLGSCQTDFLASQFKLFTTKNLHSIINWDKIQKGLPVPEEVWRADILIYQPYLGANDFNTTKIVDKLKTINPVVKCIAIPYFDFGLYSQNHVKHPEDKNTREYPFTKFGTIPKIFIECNTLDQMYKALESEEPLQNFEALQKEQFNKLRERDARCDVKVADFIEKNWKHKRLFYTRSHPTNVLFEFIMESLLDFLGWDRKLGVKLRSSLDVSINFITPRHAQNIGLTFDISEARWYNGPSRKTVDYMNEILKGL